MWSEVADGVLLSLWHQENGFQQHSKNSNGWMVNSRDGKRGTSGRQVGSGAQLRKSTIHFSSTSERNETKLFGGDSERSGTPPTRGCAPVIEFCVIADFA